MITFYASVINFLKGVKKDPTRVTFVVAVRSPKVAASGNSRI